MRCIVFLMIAYTLCCSWFYLTIKGLEKEVGMLKAEKAFMDTVYIRSSVISGDSLNIYYKYGHYILSKKEPKSGDKGFKLLYCPKE